MSSLLDQIISFCLIPWRQLAKDDVMLCLQVSSVWMTSKRYAEWSVRAVIGNALIHEGGLLKNILVEVERRVASLLNPRPPDPQHSLSLSLTRTHKLTFSRMSHLRKQKEAQKPLSCSLTSDQFSGKWVISLSLYEGWEKKTNEGN